MGSGIPVLLFPRPSQDHGQHHVQGNGEAQLHIYKAPDEVMLKSQGHIQPNVDLLQLQALQIGILTQ